MKATFIVALLISMGFATTTSCAHSGREHVPSTPATTPEPDRGWLGISTQDMTPRLAKSMGVKTKEGALVNTVSKNSPAKDAGIKAEDIIVEYDGKKISDADELVAAVRGTKPGTTVSIVLMRGDERMTVRATIDTYSSRFKGYAYSYAPPAPPKVRVFTTSRVILGVSLLELNDQLAEYFGVQAGKGVLVEEVGRRSAAEKAGIKAGDVITKVGSKDVGSVKEIQRALRKYDEGENVEVEVVRKGTKMTFTVEIPEDEHHRRSFDMRPRSHLPHEFDPNLDAEFDLDLDFDLDVNPDIDLDINILPDFDEEDTINMDALKKQMEELRARMESKKKEMREGAWKLRQELRRLLTPRFFCS